MNIEMLTNILSPPRKPIEAGNSDDWRRIEEKITTPLPTDYKRFIQIYGSGYIGDLITIWNPFATNEFLNLIWRADWTLNNLRKARVTYKEEFNKDYPPYPVFPEPEGVLPFGSTVSGEVFFWETKGTPDTWSILLQEHRNDYYEKHPYNLTRFLIMLIREKLPQTILYHEEVKEWRFEPINKG